MNRSTKLFILGIALSIIPVSGAQAKTGLLIRTAFGVVKHLTSSKDSSSGKVQRQEVASVLLEANVDKVYATTLKVVNGNKNLRITASNEKSRTINFTDGEQDVVMSVSRIQENIAQILVSAVSTTEKTSNPSSVVDGILRVCREMNTRCSVADN
jgi:hypothetical protein